LKKNDKPVRIERLAGDASVRIFSRLFFEDGSTAVEMITPKTHEPDYEKYIRTQSFLNAYSVPVPAVLETDAASLKIILEDLGGSDYYSLHTSLPEKERADYYGKFTDTVVKIASLAPEFERDYTGTKEILGFERLSWELDFFLENYLTLYPEKRPSEDDLKILKEFLTDLARETASFPTVLCHRDFHSKNIMMTGGGFRIIDFQDLRLGPYNYDLASLLWDSYVTPSDEIISAMEKRFYTALPKLGIELSLDEFRRQNRVTALQRNIKAIGTFSNQALKSKTGYVQFIAPTFEKILHHLKRIESHRKIIQIFNGFFFE
jgi:aminoglycoside/choline kinase family phosphotransferase